MEGVEVQGEIQAEEFKNRGNEEFKNGNYQQAVLLYSQALGILALVSWSS